MIDGLHDLLDMVGNIGTVLSNLDAFDGLFSRRSSGLSVPPEGVLFVRSGGLITNFPPLPNPPVMAGPATKSASGDDARIRTVL